MGFHAEEPLVALPGLMHLWISLLLPIPGGGGSVNNGGVYNGALPQQQTLLAQVLPYCLEDLLSRMVLLQKMTERQDGSGIRDVVVISSIGAGIGRYQMPLG